MEIAIERNEFATVFRRQPIFAIIPGSSVTLPTLPDVGWVLEFNIAVTTSGFDDRDLEVL
jgi:hypothetical protein